MKAPQLSDANDFKRSIRFVVAAYKRQYPEEYKLLCNAVRMQRSLLKDPKFGVVTDGHRALYEISENLQAALITYLSVDAITWFKEKEGGRWFANTYREFALPTDI